MNLIEKSLFLKKTRLLEKLDFDILLALSDKLEELRVNEGEHLFNIGDEATGIYFIIEGSVALQKSPRATPERSVEAFDFFGDESLFSEQKRGYCAIAEAPSRLFVLAKPYLFALLAECPQVAIELLSTYASHIDLCSR
jgi:CRP-like cAMP-binding protein